MSIVNYNDHPICACLFSQSCSSAEEMKAIVAKRLVSTPIYNLAFYKKFTEIGVVYDCLKL